MSYLPTFPVPCKKTTLKCLLTGKSEHISVVTYNPDNQIESVNTSAKANKTTMNGFSDASKNQDGHLYYIVAGAVGSVVFLVLIIGIVVFVWTVRLIFKSVAILPEEIPNSKEKSINNSLATKFNPSITTGCEKNS